MKFFYRILGLLTIMSFTIPSHAAFIDFTGGTVTQFSGETFITNTVINYNNVDFYEEDGIKFDFIGSSNDAFSNNLGNYYNVGNDVIHGHWQEGLHGDMESILVKKTNNASFNLDSFKITSNTGCAGCASFGDEEVYINALADGVNTSFSMLLPSDNWGFFEPNSEIFLGSEFNNISAFSFTYGSNAIGLGLDEFYISNAPIPGAIWLFASGLIGLIGMKKNHYNRA